jgi:hypothetical protein
MISSVVVSYQVKPEAVAEHVRLIEGVFAQLRAEQPGNIEYKVVRLDDGVSFVHVSTADTPDGANPLPELAAFKEFGRDSAARVATAPVPTAADIVGSYYPATPVSAVDRATLA